MSEVRSTELALEIRLDELQVEIAIAGKELDTCIAQGHRESICNRYLRKLNRLENERLKTKRQLAELKR